ncbi:hypothetical protein AKJ09_08902 [Labilithrix luteola]|uniref:DegV family protein n=1 Tax=Labilithrix luteola TaxID=1391654 RepID=A0A0K1Q935_9BACT|nr:DegV family protein [Labilithrix luteola]AKV02239.1 hypothetical protein AKJ09_08902 [Labilithrix luteola]
MRIITNPGSNVSRRALQHYGIELSPQQIVVDGVSHDTREEVSIKDIDRWVWTAKEFPHVVGTTAQEFVSMFASASTKDPEIVVLLTSKKIIQTYAAATAAARTLQSRAATRHAQISIVDSGVTDAAVGLLAIAAGELARAGIPLRTVERALEMLASRLLCVFSPGGFEHLVKGGRASWLRARVATMLNLRALVGFSDGETSAFGTIRASEGARGAVTALANQFKTSFNRGRKVWVAIMHTGGDTVEHAHALLGELSDSLSVTYTYVRPLSPSIYLHLGPGTIGAAVVPVDDLPCELPTPPPLA